ncbi:CobW domain protein [Talaromyces proteolyticus]|uniref:CobW domain protein n=1 Tax=Talaromyces proteolyticus TaxID=1131652 RepID=A0AAD4KKD0_9EURO|nr:CobW domain protein [Talaromyces proteolyticus]KAH8693717.1 CobW domain protein [Talaromyces proteolyticus]
MTIPHPPIPITIITGFLGSGKTTLLLNLIPQLPPTYRLALLKNEFGDVAIDSQLATTQSISGVRELLNGCICCNLVGQLGPALHQLRTSIQPDRIIIETSGSAFPATLAMEVNRLAREEYPGVFALDGVISVIDVENWAGYEDTSYTAKMQAKYTDMVVFNKWELVDERRFDVCLDRLADLELDPPTPWVKSDRGRVERDVLLGIDGALMARGGEELLRREVQGEGHGHRHEHEHEHEHEHQSEVEVLSVTLKGDGAGAVLDVHAFAHLLHSASKEEVYRIKGIVRCAPATAPQGSDPALPTTAGTGVYILNWAFGRWTFTPASVEEGEAARLTFILARYESGKWKKRLEAGGLVKTVEGGELVVQKLL